MTTTTASHDFDSLVTAVHSSGATAVSHHSAAYIHGLVDDPPALLHVMAQRGQHPVRRRGVIVHHTRSIDPIELATIDRRGELAALDDVDRSTTDGACSAVVANPPASVVITSVPATVVMLAPYLAPPILRMVITRAASRLGGIDELDAAARRRRRRGRSGPGRVLSAIDAIAAVSTMAAATS